MKGNLLHVYRNTPFGREILLQSIYFCRQIDARLDIYIPRSRQFLMYFRGKVVTVDLDASFLRAGESARDNALALAAGEGLTPHFLELSPRDHTSGDIPTLPVDGDFMCCPRTIRNLSTKVRLGYVGSRIRSIINMAAFPVLIPSPVFKPWRSVTVFWGGSDMAGKVLELGARISLQAGLPLYIFTQGERKDREFYLKVLGDQFSLPGLDVTPEASGVNRFRFLSKTAGTPPAGEWLSHFQRNARWMFFRKGRFVHNLYHVPHDSLAVVGSLGHGVVKELFGSKMELIQKTLPNNLLIAGPHYMPSAWGR